MSLSRLRLLRDELIALRPALDDATAILLDVLLSDVDRVLAGEADELAAVRMLRRLEPLRDVLAKFASS